MATRDPPTSRQSFLKFASNKKAYNVPGYKFNNFQMSIRFGQKLQFELPVEILTSLDSAARFPKRE